MEFRKLKAEEIKVRLKSSGLNVKNNQKSAWAMYLLYKDARCDMSILDETVGCQNWQREHEQIGNDIYCKVGINSACFTNIKEGESIAETIFPDSNSKFIWKQDCGTEGESKTEAEKSRASDSFKRACVNWGIGKELYTAPSIFVALGDNEWKEKEDVKGKIDVSNRLILSVRYISYDDTGKIKDLLITDKFDNIRFTFGNPDLSVLKKATA